MAICGESHFYLLEHVKQSLKRIFSNVPVPHLSPIIIKNILNKPRFSRVEAFLIARGIVSLNFQGPLKGTWHQLVSSSACLTAARTVMVVLSWRSWREGRIHVLKDVRVI